MIEECQKKSFLLRFYVIWLSSSYHHQEGIDYDSFEEFLMILEEFLVFDLGGFLRSLK